MKTYSPLAFAITYGFLNVSGGIILGTVSFKNPYI
jgi:hypothetical protein